jgi:hypothetical protein
VWWSDTHTWLLAGPVLVSRTARITLADLRVESVAEALADWRSKQVARHGRVRLLLGSPWLQLALSPALHTWLDEPEGAALAAQVLQVSPGLWHCRASLQGPGAAALCIGVEQALIDSLRAALSPYTLSSVQPLTGVIWERARKRLPDTGWYAHREMDRVQLLQVRNGRWLSHASQRTGLDADADLAALRQRERVRTGLGDGPLLHTSLAGRWAPGGDGVGPVDLQAWAEVLS